MKFKVVTINLACGETESFENCEWNNSDQGVSLKTTEGIYVFYPLCAIKKVSAYPYLQVA